jgi:phospholipase C
LKRSRAQAIATTIVATAATMLAACSSSNSPVTPVTPKAKIGHVIVLFQENRSFNVLFAGFPGALTAMSGPCATHFPDGTAATWCKAGTNVHLQQITLESTGKPAAGTDLQHDHAAYELEYHGGKMDGFDLVTLGTGGGQGNAKLYPYAYVERSEVKPYWDLASSYALADHMFSTATTDSFVAHQQIVAGTTQLNSHESVVDTPSAFPWGCDASPGTATSIITTSGKVITNGGPFPCFAYKSMADVLDAAKVSWKYYVYGDPFTSSGPDTDFSGSVWNGFDPIAKVRCAHFNAPDRCTGTGADWKTHISEPAGNVLGDIAKGTLPQMSWVIPGLLCSDHPASGDDKGPSWIAQVVNAVGKSKYWNDTAILILWDDWGGFYDNVAPPQTSYTSLGMRVPLIIVSPYAKSGFVSHTQYDFGSVLKFVEQTFDTDSLGTSDASATSIVDGFDFTQKAHAFTPVAARYQNPHCAAGATAKQIIDNDGGIVPE